MVPEGASSSASELAPPPCAFDLFFADNMNEFDASTRPKKLRKKLRERWAALHDWQREQYEARAAAGAR